MTIITWNTGSLYTAHGQRMAAKQVGDMIYFVDADRNIDGKFEISEFSKHIKKPIKDQVNAAYLNDTYDMLDGNDRDIVSELLDEATNPDNSL